MFRAALSLIVVLSATVYAQCASAGPYADDLAKCWVQHSTIDDKTLFAKWTFAELSLNPSLQPLTAITSEQRDALTRGVADYYQRLLFKDCRQRTIDALKYEGGLALLVASKTIGGVAFREMMNDPKTRAGMAGLNTSFDHQKMAELLKEAGLPVPPNLEHPAR